MKPGDKVVMVNCYEAKKYEGRIWTVASEPWEISGTPCVKLDGYRGGFSVACLLQLGKGTVKLSQLPNDIMVYQEDECVRTAGALRSEIVNWDEDRREGWIVGIPATWSPNAQSMLESYVENQSIELYENADEAMWDQIQPLVPQIQAILDSVKVGYYEPGANVEVDVEPARGDDE